MSFNQIVVSGELRFIILLWSNWLRETSHGVQRLVSTTIGRHCDLSCLWEFTQSHSTMRGWFGKECGFMMMCIYHICLLLYIAANFHCNKTTCIPWVKTHPKKHRGAGDFLHQVTQCHPKVKDGILRVGLFVAQEKVPGALWIGYHMCFLSWNPRTNHVFFWSSLATAWAWEGTLW